MQKIIITNVLGESIELGNTAPYILQKLEGIGNVNVDIETQKSPKQDGETYIDNTLGPRPISIEGMILAENSVAIQQKRRLIQRVFNPKLGEGTLLFVHNNEEKEIKFIVEQTPVFPSGAQNMGIKYQKFLIDLLCNNPFWKETYEESELLNTAIGGVSFPLSLPTAFSYREYKKIVQNNGDVETPVSIEIVGGAGDGGNPVITNNTTGELIKIKQPLDENDVLIISTEFGRKSVTLNGENAFNYIDLDSTFFQLVPGENEISYSSDSESIATKITITWRNRYIGV